MIVYGDLVLLVNAVVDAALLLAAARLAGVRVRIWRVALAALLGAGYALGFYLEPSSAAYTFPGKFASSLAMVAVAFAPVRPVAFVRLVGWLWTSAALVAGMTLAFDMFGLGAVGAWQSGYWTSGQGPVPWWALAGSLGALALMASWLWSWRRATAVETVEVTVEVGQRATSCRGLVDSGNRLRDPFTAAPVVVASVSAMADLLPESWPRDPRRAVEDWSVLEEVASTTDLAGRLRLVPFEALGTRRGLLVALKADRVRLRAGRRRWVHDGILVGLSPDPLDPGGAFAALVPTELVAAEPMEGSGIM
ncbi:MAG: sigma-E processing peptidase SpoIIGA [Clostridia bacterium]|nr:sigma-E processing peptidase SpoIIGA [Clostridia bacterium]